LPGLQGRIACDTHDLSWLKKSGWEGKYAGGPILPKNGRRSGTFSALGAFLFCSED